MKNACKACSKSKMGVGIATGVAIGAGIGSATGNMAEAVGLGGALGVVLGAGWNKRANQSGIASKQIILEDLGK